MILQFLRLFSAFRKVERDLNVMRGRVDVLEERLNELSGETGSIYVMRQMIAITPPHSCEIYGIEIPK